MSTNGTLGDAGTIAVVGLGLIGGSLARDLAARGHRVIAADTDRAALDAAMARGVLAGTFRVADSPDHGDHGDIGDIGDLGDVRVVVIATPSPAGIRVLGWLADAGPPGAVLTDVGSTKRSIMEAAGKAGVAGRFVGGHPMAGDHRSGWAAGGEGRFIGAPVWLCTAGAEPAAVERVEALWADVGALPRRIDAAEHDRMVAWSSHLPQLLASALARALDGAGIEQSRLGPGGHDTTRLAGSDPAMWTDILMDNADALEPALAALMDELVGLRRHLEVMDHASLRAALEDARRWGSPVRNPAPAAAP